MMEMFEKLPGPVQTALVTLAVTTLTALTAAIQQWLKARFMTGAFSNVVEAIHHGECTECAEMARGLNQADGIEDRVKPLVQKIKENA